MTTRTTYTSACPNCGVTADRDAYDIGDGPELACANCEWCWGAEGQSLTFVPPIMQEVVEDLGLDLDLESPLTATVPGEVARE